MSMNVELAWNRILKLRSSLTEKSLPELRLLAGGIKTFTDKYISKFVEQVHHNKIVLLQNISSQLANLQIASDPAQINVLCNDINNLYARYNAIPSIYLLRHPEKFVAGQVAPEETGQRALTTQGVIQSKEFAELLISEMLVTNIPVSLQIDFSYYKRTKLFSQIIEAKANWASAEYGKPIRVKTAVSDLLSGDLMYIPKPTPKQIDEYFISWLPTQNAKEVAAATQGWFASKELVPNTYTIHVGITHRPNVVAFLLHNLKVDPALAARFTYTDFLKSEGGNFYYAKKWY